MDYSLHTKWIQVAARLSLRVRKAEVKAKVEVKSKA